ncbi:MAG: IS110 family transposase [Eubacteriaceae bacterium]|nr:IS110 family transposase [Eubacteriaceae bacterium]
MSNENNINSKIESITKETLIVGIDIAKRTHAAQFTDWRGATVAAHLEFTNDGAGFEAILSEIALERSQYFTRVATIQKPALNI